MARAEIVDIPKNKEMCINCRKVLAIKNNFYAINDNAIEHKVYKNGCIPICKNCLNEMCYTDKKQTKIDIESFKMVLAILQIPFKEDVFDEMIKNNSFTLGDYKNKVNFMCKNDIYYNQSETKTDNEEDKINKVSVKEDDFEITQDMITTWGEGFSKHEYMKLEREYNDLINENNDNLKVSRDLYIEYVKNKIFIDRSTNDADMRMKLIKLNSEIMKIAGIQPTNKTDGIETIPGVIAELIEREEPIPEVSKEFKDVDNIGLYIDTFMKEPIKRNEGTSIEPVEKDFEKVESLNGKIF